MNNFYSSLPEGFVFFKLHIPAAFAPFNQEVLLKSQLL